MSEHALYEISNSDYLLRSLPKKPDFIGADNTFTSAVFKKKKDEDGVSVNIDFLVLDFDSIHNQDTHHIASLCAEVPFSLNCDCKHDPNPTNNAHALILHVTPSIARKLGKQAKLKITPKLST